MLSDHLDSTVSCQYSHNCPVIVCHLLCYDALRSLRQHSELSVFTQLPCYCVPVAVLWCCSYTGSSSLCNRPIAASRASSAQCVSYYFILQISLPPAFLKVNQNLLTASFFPPISFIFPSIQCFWRQFLCSMWPVELVFLFFLIYVGYFFPWMCAILLSVSHGPSNWSSLYFCNTFQNSWLHNHSNWNGFPFNP